MGTRAQFFIGNPQDIENRKWLGCVAWDGYPDGDIGDALNGVSDEAGFIKAVQGIASQREDFCNPAQHGFPFPWDDDLYLTDCTYAFFDGKVMLTRFHRGWIELAAYLASEQTQEEYDGGADRLPSNVPAPSQHDSTGPDSIMIVSVTPDAA